MNESIISKIKPVPIVVAGDVMVDEYIIGEVERISPESPVPVVVARDRLRRLGGAGNVVRNLVAMGGMVALLSAVGKDGAGTWFRRRCEEMSVEGFWLKDDSSRPTTIKTRVVARNQQIVRIDEERISDLSPELEKAVIEDVKAVMPQVKAAIISDYGKGFVTPNLVRTIITTARLNGVPVLVDPKGRDFSRYQDCTFITPNVREASTASGVDIRDPESLEKAGKILLDQTKARGVVITRGRHGITLVTRQRAQDFPVKPMEIVDVTGAGDTVISSLTMAVANGLTIENAVVIANLAASIAVSRFGAASVSLDDMVNALHGMSPDNKIVPLGDISGVLRKHQVQGQKIVFTNGVFDLFHTGHLEILRKASALGDVLVVGVNSDASVSRIKGPERPIMNQADRVEVIAALGFVDYVAIFEEDTPLRLIEDVRPDVLVKGEDWRGKEIVGEDVVKRKGGRVELVKLLGGVSTTELIRRIRGGA